MDSHSTPVTDREKESGRETGRRRECVSPYWFNGLKGLTDHSSFIIDMTEEPQQDQKNNEKTL